jgi:cytochrome c5
MRKTGIIILVISICLFLIVGCTSTNSSATVDNSSATTVVSSAPASTTSSSSGSTTSADGKTLLETRCTSCHTLAKVVNLKGTADQWKQVVDQMVQRGAVLSPDEETVLVQYLAANFK